MRARVGMLLGELPNLSHLVDLLVNSWHSASHQTPTPESMGMMLAAPDDKQEGRPHMTSSPGFGQLEGKLRQWVQTVTYEIMRYCGRA